MGSRATMRERGVEGIREARCRCCCSGKRGKEKREKRRNCGKKRRKWTWKEGKEGGCDMGVRGV